MLWIVALVLAALTVVGVAVWWRRRARSPRQLHNEDYERALGQAYLQAQHTRNNIGDPFH
jgi:hypothetical protein